MIVEGFELFATDFAVAFGGPSQITIQPGLGNSYVAERTRSLRRLALARCFDVFSRADSQRADEWREKK
jgi:hypothetical protein